MQQTVCDRCHTSLPIGVSARAQIFRSEQPAIELCAACATDLHIWLTGARPVPLPISGTSWTMHHTNPLADWKD
jgi:hypothetical protein